MNNINTIQVQSTNDASTISKCSAVSKSYFRDDFIGEFVDKKKTRASLIHLGYYTRAVILYKLITDYIEFLNLNKISKIISLGAGFDTTYWRLSELNLLSKCVFIEIDFSSVIKKKIFYINQSQKLKSCAGESTQIEEGIHKLNFNYYLLEADLSDIFLVEKLFNIIKISYDIPTLFLSECVITYMKEEDSSNLIKWMGMKFANCGFINYEQIHPNDGFGQIMLKHFDKLQSSLFSVSKYPDCKSHYFRYKNHGFESSSAISEWDALIRITSEEERRRVFSLELFDEFEEFILKCVHYVVAVAGNGITSRWISSNFSSFKNFTESEDSRIYLNCDRLECDLQIFRHFSCSSEKNDYIFGGCGRQCRSQKIYKVNFENTSLDIKTLDNADENLTLDMVFGSAVHFKLNKIPFVCLYGGRTAPNRIWNNGAPTVFEIVDNKFTSRVIINQGNPTPRYRTAMAALNSSENEVHCWIFGGRTVNLNDTLSDFWRLTITCDNEKNLSYSWKKYEKKNENWPCGRISHSLTSCPKRFELFMVGGLMLDSSSVLNDMWKWSYRTESWEKVQLAGRLLPRFGHTSHLKDELIYLVGGVNSLSGLQPGVARIDLKNLNVIEYAISSSIPETFLLFNHTSTIVTDEDDTLIYVIGGGGNCFSFGTYLNQCALCIKLTQS